MATITLDGVTKRYPDGVLALRDLTLDIADGELLVLVGPSGCGKSTALQLIAGLEEISGGELRIDGRLVNALPPKERDVAMVFQSYALYPHMTVRDNMAFALRQANLTKGAINERVVEAAHVLELEAHLDRKPGQLSGGQRQRVAMGRAIVRDPKAFLMDEPLSNLDAKLRVQMRSELARLQSRLGTTTIYVTHDQSEAMTLGHRIAVLRGGVLQQVGTPDEVYEHPRNLFVAGFVGSPSMNFLNGRLDDGKLRTPLGDIPVDRMEPATVAALGDSRDLIIGVRPEDFAEVRGADVGAADGIEVEVPVAAVESTGPDVFAHLALEGGGHVVADQLEELAPEESLGVTTDALLVIARLARGAGVRPGERARLWMDTRRLQVFTPDGTSLLDARAKHGAAA